MEPFKNLFNKKSIGDLGKQITIVESTFDFKKFMSLVFDSEWKNRELKERLRHITLCLGKTLPSDFKKATDTLIAVSKASLENRFEYLVLPDYIEVFGLDHWDIAVPALKELTKSSTSEGAVRPFIIKDQARMLATMLEWTQDKDVHVRRLASEGCRPRLPWMIALPALKKDPTPILPILEALKNDPERYVQLSVANNLNDIAKDHPDLTLSTAQKWKGTSKSTDWVVKHACRTLLKKGIPGALRLFGFDDPKDIVISNLNLSTSSLKIGDKLLFKFNLNCKKPGRLRLEYVIDYVKASGKTSPKVFQIGERTQTKLNDTVKSTQSFADVSIRKHYPGTHHITIRVNGEEKASTSFELK
ncbi:hypothetical protein HOH87_05920 [bacterium]|jgi:3-methyladenine DNA glycosylase AlkC|nr:hypothetical protein [bacterium]